MREQIEADSREKQAIKDIKVGKSSGVSIPDVRWPLVRFLDFWGAIKLFFTVPTTGNGGTCIGTQLVLSTNQQQQASEIDKEVKSVEEWRSKNVRIPPPAQQEQSMTVPGPSEFHPL